MSSRKLLLVRSEILGLFVNTSTADGKYSRHNRENFLQKIQMRLYQKTKTFSDLFIAFLKSTSNFEYFEKKYESHFISISEIIDSERGDYINV